MDRLENGTRQNQKPKNIKLLFKRNKIAGVDEVGRGCLAGPVFSAAVILNKKINKKDITEKEF